MAERIAQGRATREHLVGVEFSSAGVSSEELGNSIDPRARMWLEGSGYTAENHRAHRITAKEIDGADLVIAMERLHIDRMLQLHPSRTDHIRLLSSFDPAAKEGSGVPDPWYGSADGFGDTMAALESAMPGVFAAVRDIPHPE